MNDNIFTLIIAVIVIVLISEVTYYEYSEMKSLERNVESAIAKGIDPVAVRCAYANKSDTICIAYAASRPK